MHIIELLQRPWPWWVAGPLIGLTVPLLLLAGNKALGISSTLRQVCAACFPGRVSFFRYDWKKDSWNLFFAAGIVLGGWIAVRYFDGGQPVGLSTATVESLHSQGIQRIDDGLLPTEIFSWEALGTVRGLVFIVLGGLLVGFGTRYAGGCTSGHSIMGLSTLQWPSLVATLCFMAGGFFMSRLVLPWLLKL